MVQRAGLQDLGYSGPAYTWSNGQPDSSLIRQRIDRALASATWLARFPHAKVKHLPRMNSDHAPLLLTTAPPGNRRGKMFKMENWWYMRPEFNEICNRAIERGSEDWNVFLGSLKSTVKTWVKGIPNPDTACTQLEEAIAQLQLNPVATQQHEAQLIQEYNSLLLAREAYWAQRSRIRWATYGDSNCSFFHISASARRRRNQINSLLVRDDQWATTEAEIRSAIVQYFKSIFCASLPFEGRSIHSLHENFLNTIPKLDPNLIDTLSALPSESEITVIVFSIHPDRAAGPDGINARFIQNQWHLLKELIIKQVKRFFHTKTMCQDMAKSNLVLVPKKEVPQKVADYRPISVCNVIYKIISKLLSRRLQPYIATLVSPMQSAFTPGRQIGDNVIIFREVMHSFSLPTYKKASFCLKADLSKAFDKLRWSYIFSVLQLYGLPKDYIDWVKACVTSARFSILINGSADGFIKPVRGVRQGCALSPYLFILALDVLTRLLQYMVQRGKIRGVQLARGAPKLTNLMYADDLLIFGEATYQEISAISNVLSLFCEISGQEIGVNKSRIWFSRSTPQDVRSYAMHIFDATTASSSDIYLGSPILANRGSDFTPLLNKIDAKLQGWKSQFLSQTGKIVLIKSVIEPILLYAMSTAHIPRGVLCAIQKKIRQFFWSNGSQTRMPLVAWKHITVAKSKGGLGLKDVFVMNKSLSLKALWAVATRNPSTWVQPSWQIPKLISHFDFHGALYIAMLFPDGITLSDNPDRPIFIAAKNGKFTLKAAYSAILSQENITPVSPLMRILLNKLWYCPGLLPRVRIFLWKAIRTALPVDQVFVARLGKNPQGCLICGHQTENITHTLFKCPQARCIWLSSSLGVRTENLPDEIDLLMGELLSARDDDVFRQIANIMWCYWKARCKHVYEGKMIKRDKVLAHAAGLERLMILAQEPTNATILQAENGMVTSPYSCYVDGSWIDQSDRGAGWSYVLSTSENHLIQYQVSATQASSPLHAEVLAMKAAIKEIKMGNYMPCTLFTDCITLHRVITGIEKADSVEWRVYRDMLELGDGMGFACGSGFVRLETGRGGEEKQEELTAVDSYGMI
ncbi:RNA-directed DNA polymerase (reverse transcriptase)-related family protein [Rhynchospora pubera]|uniref:RNA-directed DNA polymerase (Reverse transcriptase)-related family protein n=1 Tax=Rhynchospora pubera TaxID=906938 RepID=A0AAV8H6C2_9POAL|nr:RNA-directed DNA polymerase (reverse transcriptase)-related family protein [Rhynchospora pubera]